MLEYRQILKKIYKMGKYTLEHIVLEHVENNGRLDHFEVVYRRDDGVRVRAPLFAPIRLGDSIFKDPEYKTKQYRKMLVEFIEKYGKELINSNSK